MQESPRAARRSKSAALCYQGRGSLVATDLWLSTGFKLVRKVGPSSLAPSPFLAIERERPGHFSLDQAARPLNDF